jgi:hypothetical protein
LFVGPHAPGSGKKAMVFASLTSFSFTLRCRAASTETYLVRPPHVATL